MDIRGHPDKKIAKTPAHFLREEPKSYLPCQRKPQSKIPAESPEVAKTSWLFLASSQRKTLERELLIDEEEEEIDDKS